MFRTRMNLVVVFLFFFFVFVFFFWTQLTEFGSFPFFAVSAAVLTRGSRAAHVPVLRVLLSASFCLVVVVVVVVVVAFFFSLLRRAFLSFSSPSLRSRFCFVGRLFLFLFFFFLPFAFCSVSSFVSLWLWNDSRPLSFAARFPN